MGGVVGQGVSRAVCCGLRRSGSSQQGGLVQSGLRQNGRRGGESSVGSGGRQTCKQTQKSGPLHDGFTTCTEMPGDVWSAGAFQRQHT